MPENWKPRGTHRWEERGGGGTGHHPRRHSQHQSQHSRGNSYGNYNNRTSYGRRDEGGYHGYEGRYRSRDYQGNYGGKSHNEISQEEKQLQSSTQPPEDSEPKSSVPNWITSLEDELDNKLLVILKDGRKFIGLLRTFDQFGSIVLEKAVERIVVDKYYYDIDVQCMIIRGENIVLFGAIDESKPSALEQRPAYEVLEMLKKQEEEEKKKPKKTSRNGWTEAGDDW